MLHDCNTSAILLHRIVGVALGLLEAVESKRVFPPSVRGDGQ